MVAPTNDSTPKEEAWNDMEAYFPDVTHTYATRRCVGGKELLERIKSVAEEAGMAVEERPVQRWPYMVALKNNPRGEDVVMPYLDLDTFPVTPYAEAPLSVRELRMSLPGPSGDVLGTASIIFDTESMMDRVAVSIHDGAGWVGAQAPLDHRVAPYTRNRLVPAFRAVPVPRENLGSLRPVYETANTLVMRVIDEVAHD